MLADLFSRLLAILNIFLYVSLFIIILRLIHKIILLEEITKTLNLASTANWHKREVTAVILRQKHA